MVSKLFFPLVLFSCLLLAACQKKSNIDIEYWIARQAGAYELQSIKATTYKDGVLSKDTTINYGNSTLVLKSVPAEGVTCFVMDMYGPFLPQFLNFPSTGYAWVTETDDKRLSLGVLDPSIGYVPHASLTVDKMGAAEQEWNYVNAYDLNGRHIYIHETWKMKRL